MNTYLKRLMIRARLMKPAEEGDSGAAAAVDRGDDFTPTAETVAAAEKAGTISAADAEAERAKLGLPAAKAAPAPAAKVETAATDDAEDDDAEDEDADAAAAAAAKPAKKDSRIPLARHEAILAAERARREAAEQAVATFEKGKAVAATNEQIAELEAKITTLEEQYNDAIAEGESKKASALMKEIRTSERTVIEQKAEFRAQLATAQAVESIRYDAVVDRIEAAFPQIRPGAEEYDQSVVDDVVELQKAYVATGQYAPSQAMQRAVDKLLKPATAKQAAATAVTPRVDADDAAAAAKKLERDTAARKKNAAAANAQPPALAATGTDSDKAGGLLDAAKVIKLPFDQFMKTGPSEEELSRLRGDTV